MFWNDPNLYGVTFKDVAGKEPFFGAPFAPWMNAPWNLQRFAPPTYGFLPQNFNLPPTPIPPFAPTALHGYVPPPMFEPYLPSTPIHPFAPTAIHPFAPTALHGYVPPTMFEPYLPPKFVPYPLNFGMNAPFYGFYRPYTF
jgi:hypothetical protein